jgi:hypothetical protein
MAAKIIAKKMMTTTRMGRNKKNGNRLTALHWRGAGENKQIRLSDNC